VYRLLALLVFLVAGAASAQTGIGDPAMHAAAAQLRPGEYRWEDAVAAPGVAIVVSLSLQRIYVYRGGALVGVARVSTGKRGKATPPGDFPILQKARFHRSNLYSNAPMPFMQRLTWTGIALHAGHDPGYPASHGCIRLPLAFARDLFAMTRLGTPVTVADYPTQLPVLLSVDDFGYGAVAEPEPLLIYDLRALS
jgi:lipoprotein-anchoring transpeptidase ErfK/SrfK